LMTTRHNLLVAVVLVVFLCTGAVADKLLFVISVARHGARKPKSFVYKDGLFSETGFQQGPGAFTMEGTTQMRSLGTLLRGRYTLQYSLLKNKSNAND
jgi:hypothetical protein